MEGWKKSKLGDIADVSYGFTAKASFDVQGPKFLRITDIQNGLVDWEAVPNCKIEDEKLSKHKLQSGDIVFARTGATTGKSYLIYQPPESVAASYLIRLRIQDDWVLPDYVALYFQSSDYWEHVVKNTSGSAQGGFNASKLASMVVPIPPLPEQKRIVAILDEAFAAIDKAMANTEKNFANAKELFRSQLNFIFDQSQAGMQCDEKISSLSSEIETKSEAEVRKNSERGKRALPSNSRPKAIDTSPRNESS